MATVQETIRRLRQLGLSQSEIGRAVGIPQPRVSRWEAGDVPESVDDALKLVEFLARIERQARPPEGDPTRSHPGPLAESGQGAKPGCASVEQGSTADRAGSGGQQRVVAPRTAVSERREVV